MAKDKVPQKLSRLQTAGGASWRVRVRHFQKERLEVERLGYFFANTFAWRLENWARIHQRDRDYPLPYLVRLALASHLNTDTTKLEMSFLREPRRILLRYARAHGTALRHWPAKKVNAGWLPPMPRQKKRSA